MSNILKGLNEGRDSWDSNMPGYQGDYGGAKNFGRRHREDDEHHEIDRQRELQLQQYNQSGKFWLKLKDSQRHLPAGPFTGKQAATQAALDLLKQQPELKGNLLITAYGPDEQLDELSPQTLASYKKKAGADATASDKRGDYKRGDKRMSGIMKATRKEFDNDSKGVAEGWGKTIKRLATGKDVKSRAGQEIAKSQDANMKGDNKTANKHFKRYDKLDKLANKEQGVAEGSMPYPHGKPEAGDKITWYHSNHYPELEGTVVGWKDGHLIVQSIDPSPRNTEKTVVKYRVPKNNILSVEKQGVAEEEKNPHTSAIGRALYRDLSKEKKASPQQVQRNKERWAQRQAEREQGVAEGKQSSIMKGLTK